eukprot:963206-Prymnesium_polylepis.1
MVVRGGGVGGGCGEMGAKATFFVSRQTYWSACPSCAPPPPWPPPPRPPAPWPPAPWPPAPYPAGA